jgi:lysophospholipase L1-like esterase
MSSSSECRAASRWLREESSDLLAHRLGALPQAFGTGHPRLQTKLHECLCAALPGVQSAPALVIAVMGASMAAGAMNCNARVICNGTNLAPHLAWPRKLQERLSAAVPRCRVEVSVLGYGGTTSETSAYTLGEVLKRHKSGQKPLDAVLLDTSTNDFVVSQWGQNKERRQYLLAAIESMVRRLEYAGVTAVLVDTLTGPSFECPTKSPNKDATRTTRRAPLVGDSLYAPLAAHWGVPFVSLLSSSCAACKCSPRRLPPPHR